MDRLFRLDGKIAMIAGSPLLVADDGGDRDRRHAEVLMGAKDGKVQQPN